MFEGDLYIVCYDSSMATRTVRSLLFVWLSLLDYIEISSISSDMVG
jgi:hypothetical protein